MSIPTRLVANARNAEAKRKKQNHGSTSRDPFPAEGDALPKRSQADRILELAKERYQLGMSSEGDPFAVEVAGPNIALMLRGGRNSIRASLARDYWKTEGRAPSASALADALTVLEGEAMLESGRPTAVRVAEYGTEVYIDMGEPKGSALEISEHGWMVTNVSPVTFRRTALTAELPIPVRGGSLQSLRSLLNVTDESWALVIGWLVAAFFPTMPHPVLMLGGEQGTGKSSLARLIVGLVDPSPAPLRSEPRDPESWAMAAAGSWVVPIDNLSSLSAWFSDALCKCVTGDGWIRRTLYSNSELSVLVMRRCVILTSIDAGALRGDLADRLLVVDLMRIEDGLRRTEASLDSEYSRLRPALFGALLDVVVAVRRILPAVQLDSLPRMADFARVLAALDTVRPDLTGGQALKVYLGQKEQLAEDVLESDPVASAIAPFASGLGWEGTASELLHKIAPERVPAGWPKSAKALSGRLRRMIPALRLRGIEVTLGRTNTKRLITITTLPETLGPCTDLNHADDLLNGSSLLSPGSPLRGDNDVDDVSDADKPKISAGVATDVDGFDWWGEMKA